MHRHDLDLIAALAEGSLQDETRARARVETCAMCRAEFDRHTEVIRMLRTTPPVAMTDLERATLHREVRTGLHQPQAGPVPAPPWTRWAYATAALFLVVGLGAALARQGGPTSGEDFVTVAADRAVEETADVTAAGGEAPADQSQFAAVAEEVRAESSSAITRTEAYDDEKTEDCLRSAGLDDHVVARRLDLDRSYLVAVTAQIEDLAPVWFVDATECRVVHVEE